MCSRIITTASYFRPGSRPAGRQKGASLMETMIALALSAVVVSGMVMLMGNSVGTSNRVIQMTQLTDELRNTMNMMTRDVRRANYSATAVLCYGNPNCSDHDWSRQVNSGDALGDVVVDGECLLYQLDRSLDGDATDDSKGGFRRMVVSGVGVMQMWVSDEADAPSCDDAADVAGWMAISDPNIVDVKRFDIDDALSQEKSILQGGGATSFTQRQRQLTLSVEGELVLEQRMGWTQTENDIMVQRRVADMIRVRNDFLSPPVPVSP